METMKRNRGEVLSPEEVADYLGCGRTKAYALLAERAIPSFSVGRLRRVRLSDVDRFIERQLAAYEDGQD